MLEQGAGVGGSLPRCYPRLRLPPAGLGIWLYGFQGDWRGVISGFNGTIECVTVSQKVSPFVGTDTSSCVVTTMQPSGLTHRQESPVNIIKVISVIETYVYGRSM